MNMRVINTMDAGVHYQKSDLRNHYKEILTKLHKEGKLFIDDRNSRSVAVMFSYQMYHDMVQALAKIDELQDEIDCSEALRRSKDGSKPISSGELKKALGLK